MKKSDDSASPQMLEELERCRPKTRSECRNNGIRPCPFFACKHNLHLDITFAGSLKHNFSFEEAIETGSPSCVLDIVESGVDVTLENIADIWEITREAVRQIELAGIRKLKNREALQILRK